MGVNFGNETSLYTFQILRFFISLFKENRWYIVFYYNIIANTYWRNLKFQRSLYLWNNKFSLVIIADTKCIRENVSVFFNPFILLSLLKQSFSIGNSLTWIFSEKKTTFYLTGCIQVLRYRYFQGSKRSRVHFDRKHFLMDLICILKKLWYMKEETSNYCRPKVLEQGPSNVENVV